MKFIWGVLRNWWDDWMHWAWLGLIWIVCLMTVLLGPPATFALVYAAHHSLSEGENCRIGDLVGIARKYAAVSWLWMVMNLAAAGIMILDFSFFFMAEPSALQVILQAAYIFFVFLWWCVQFYTLPFLFQQEHKNLGLALKNGLLTALAFPFFTLLVCGTGLGLVILSIYLVLPMALGVPGLAVTLGVHAVHNRLEIIGLRSPQPDPEDEGSRFQ